MISFNILKQITCEHYYSLSLSPPLSLPLPISFSLPLSVTLSFYTSACPSSPQNMDRKTLNKQANVNFVPVRYAFEWIDIRLRDELDHLIMVSLRCVCVGVIGWTTPFCHIESSNYITSDNCPKYLVHIVVQHWLSLPSEASASWHNQSPPHRRACARVCMRTTNWFWLCHAIVVAKNSKLNKTKATPFGRPPPPHILMPDQNLKIPPMRRAFTKVEPFNVPDTEHTHAYSFNSCVHWAKHTIIKPFRRGAFFFSPLPFNHPISSSSHHQFQRWLTVCSSFLVP